MKDFKRVTESEYNTLKDAIAIITAYIASADGEIHPEETEWAEKVTAIRAYNLPKDLGEFYTDVGTDFQEKLDYYINHAPNDHKEKMAFYEMKLSELNPILAKLDNKLGSELYSSYLSFAKHVAKASGGFFGFFNIGPEEAAILDLSMIDPIIREEEEDEA